MQLVKYYDTLYKSAKHFDKRRRKLLYSALVLLGLSFHGQGLYVYFSSILALLCQIVAWYYYRQTKRYRNLAHDIHVIAMLHDAYGKIDSRFNVADLIAKIPRKAYNEAQLSAKLEEYNTGKTDKANEKFMRMIQENSYWNNHLYKLVFSARRKFLIGAIIFFVFIIFVSIPFFNFASNLWLIRIIFLVLSFSVLYEIIESTFVFNESSEEMSILDNEISRTSKITEQHMIRIFSKYSEILLTTPDFPKKFRDKNEKRLNEGWAQRIIEMEKRFGAFEQN